MTTPTIDGAVCRTRYRNRPGPLRCPSCGQHVTARHWYRSGRPRCANNRTWTLPRRFRLMELLERGWSDARIAADMGVTAEAVNLARKRYDIPCRSRTVLSCRAVADQLGLGCSKTVRTWVHRGWLGATRGPKRGPHAQWQIHPDALHAFLDDPAHFHRWRPEAITDARLRAWAIHRRGDVRFLTLREAAHRMCVQPATVHQWIAKGWLPAVRVGDGAGNHVVRESDLTGFVLPTIGGRRGKG